MLNVKSVNLALFKESMFASSKRKPYLILGAFLGLILFYFVRSCSFNHPNEYYRIGQDTRWHELHLSGKERNLVAFNNELLSTIAKQEHFLIRLIPTSHPLNDLQDAKVDAILTSLQPSYLHQDLLFSDPFFLTGSVLIVSAQSNPQQKKGKNIIGIPETSPLLSQLEQDPSIQIKFYDDILQALGDLKNKHIDGAIFPAIPAYTYADTFYRNELKIATLPLTDEGIRLAALKNPEGRDLIDKFNEGLNSIKENKTYNEMLHRWGLIDTEHIVHEQSLK